MLQVLTLPMGFDCLAVLVGNADCTDKGAKAIRAREIIK